MIKEKQQDTIKAIIKRGGAILLVKDLKDVWELPGGRINLGETPEQALLRELKEELGFNNVKIGNIVFAFSFVSNSTKAQYKVTVYECFTSEDIILQTSEAKEYKLVKLGEIDNLNMQNDYKQAINRCL